tara:strand:- start:2083 stop:3207 length:1125 start_codon:yes stop_codon:yes gene_type:complete
MKIDKVRAINIDIPLEKKFSGGTYDINKRSVLITRIYTADGLVSETFCGDDRFRGHVIAKIINETFGSELLGKDPSKIDDIWNHLFKTFIKDMASDNRPILRSTFMRALACVDFALWDILGKIQKRPVIELLGGVRERLKVSTIGGYYLDGKGEDEIAQEMLNYQQMGYKACKFKVGKLHPREDFNRVLAAKRAVTEDFELMVDVNCGYSLDQAKEFCTMIDDLDIRWLEEPCHWWDDIHFMSELKKHTKVNIAAGQSEINHFGVRRMIEKNAIDVCNLDSFHAGGISEWKKAAKICGEKNIEMAHHEEAAIAMHLLGSETLGTFVEIFADPARDPFHEKVWVNKPIIKEGFIDVPRGDGLGIELDWDLIEYYS